MASTGTIKAGLAFVQLSLDDAQFKKGLSAASRSLKDWGQTVRAVGASIGAIGGSIEAGLTMAQHAFQATGSALARLSMRTGISVEKLSALQYAAEENAVDGEKLNVALTRMARFIEGASHGSAEARLNLDRLGVSFEELKGIGADEAFEKFADGLMKIENPLERLALAQKVFGRGSAELLPLLSQGSEGLKEMYRQAGVHGRIFSTEDAAAALELDKASRALTGSLRMITLQIGAGLAPYATAFYRKLTEITTGVVKWTRENRALAHVLDLVGVTLVIVGGAIAGVGSAVFLLGVILPGVTTALGVLAAVVTAILSPTGLMIIAAVGMAAALAKGAHEAGLFDGALRALNESVKRAPGEQAGYVGFLEAIEGSEVGLAFEHLTTGMALTMKQLMIGMKMGWAAFANWVKDLWGALLANVKSNSNLAIQAVLKLAAAMPGGEKLLGVAGLDMSKFDVSAPYKEAAAESEKRKKELANSPPVSKEDLEDLDELQRNFNAEATAAGKAKSAAALPKGLASDYSDLTKFAQYGTFNGAAAQFQFGGTGAAEKTAQNTARLVELFQDFNNAAKTAAKTAPGRFADMGEYD